MAFVGRGLDNASSVRAKHLAGLPGKMVSESAAAGGGEGAMLKRTCLGGPVLAGSSCRGRASRGGTAVWVEEPLV